MHSFLYREEEGLKTDLSLDELVEEVNEEKVTFWIDVPGDETTLTELGKKFSFHPLTVEDCIQESQRSKVDVFDEYIFIIVKAPDLNFERGDMKSNELDIIIGENFIITNHAGSPQSVDIIMNRTREHPEQLLGRGPDLLAHAVIDQSVDNYLLLLEKIDALVAQIEDEVFENPDQDLLEGISDLRRDLLYLQRTLGPQRDTVGRLTWVETPFISNKTKPYFRDVEDHMARVRELITNYREIISGSRDMYLTVVSNRMNEIMKTLTIIATIFIPLTFVAGVYGMNFTYMPELDWPWGYFATLGVMGTLTGGMILYFVRKGWIGGD